MSSSITSSPALAIFVVFGFVTNKLAGQGFDRLADILLDTIGLGKDSLPGKIVAAIVRAASFIVATLLTTQLFSTLPQYVPMWSGLGAGDIAFAVGTQAAVLGGSMPGFGATLDSIVPALPI